MNGSDANAPRTPMWDWPSWIKGSVPNPLDVFAAPQNLVQPILPDWVLGGVVNVTEQNSSAPDTEREIVAKQSYGRQLGRIIDALAVLIAEQEKQGRKSEAFERFMKLDRDINAVKTRAAANRLDRVIADLAMLKQKEPEQYRRVAAALREFLQQE